MDKDTRESLRKPGRRAQERQDIVLRRKFVPKFWADADTRLHVVRLIRKRVERMMTEAGGHESLQRELLCQRSAFISIQLESMEVEAAEGGDIDWASYGQQLNTLTGCLKALGLERRMKAANGLQDYLEQKRNGNGRGIQ